MAILKNLIVNGVTKLLSDAYLSVVKSGTWNGSTIGVGYGGTGVTTGKGSAYTPVYLDSNNGITACSFTINADQNTVVEKTLTLSSTTKLTPDAWTTAFSISGLSGTYSLQITYSGTTSSGVFSSSGNITNILDEIPLHFSGTSSSTRIYAATNGSSLQLSASGELSSGTVTIKYKKLI